jgi:HPt (histidine-containing phosphotransfer) domain-containing protein
MDNTNNQENSEDLVNLSGLREITGGNADMEKELFLEFFFTAEKCISVMRENWNNNSNTDLWRTSAHSIKGTSLMLGASKLASLCKQAQIGCEDSPEIKFPLYQQIESEYQKVKSYLNQIINNSLS